MNVSHDVFWFFVIKWNEEKFLLDISNETCYHVVKGQLMQKNYTRLIKWISIIHRYFQSYMNKRLKPHGLSSSEFLYILLVYNSGDSLTQEALAKELHLDNAAVTRSLKSLETKGFIVRKRDEENHRLKRVYLTKQSYDFVPILRKVLDEWDDYLKSTIDPETYAVVAEGLEEMTLNILK